MNNGVSSATVHTLQTQLAETQALLSVHVEKTHKNSVLVSTSMRVACPMSDNVTVITEMCMVFIVR